VDGSISPNSEIGVGIYEALASLGTVKQADITQLVQERTQDIAMLSYLTTLIDTQVQIAEKLNSIL
jgi:hypothetical protein